MGIPGTVRFANASDSGGKGLSVEQLRARASPLLRKKRRPEFIPEPRDAPPLEITDARLREVIKQLPGYDPFRDSADFEFRPALARKALNFFAQRLTHARGALSGKPFIPTDAQKAWLANLFGWVRKSDGGPRYRTAFLTEARGEGKTTEAAGCALFVLTDEATVTTGAEIYSAAYSREQANLVWGQAKKMVSADDWLATQLATYTRAIVHNADELTSYQSIAAEAHSAWGFTPRFVVVDELHAQKNRNLVDALESSKPKRKDSQFLFITTAGDNPTAESICWEVYQYACDVRDGKKRDPTFLPAIYEVPRDADWTDESFWHLAHPNRFADQLEDLRAECEKAKSNPAQQNRFRQLHLNQWVSTGSRWIDLETFRACDGEFTLESMAGRDCYGGLDMGQTMALAGFSLCWPPKTPDEPYRLAVWHFMPDKDLVHREEIDRASYRVWRQAGLLQTTSQESTDYGQIRERVAWAAKTFRLKLLGYDRWELSETIKWLEQTARIKCFKHGQGYSGMAGPVKEFERLVLTKRLAYNRNPMLDWQINHCAVETDPAGNRKPHKGNSRGFIDGLVSSIMAVGLAVENSAKRGSVYETREPLELKI